MTCPKTIIRHVLVIRYFRKPGPRFLLYILISVEDSNNLRSRYGYTTFSPRLFCDLTTLIKIFLRSSRSHDHSTSHPIATRSYHASTAIIARSYHVYTSFIARSYYVLSNNVNIVFHINIVLFLLFLIKS